MLLNRPLQEAAQKNLEIVGAPAYTEEEQSFARELQGFLKIEQKGLSTSIRPLAGEPELAEGGSTDVAEVSRITPTVSITVASAGGSCIPPGRGQKTIRCFLAGSCRG